MSDMESARARAVIDGAFVVLTAALLLMTVVWHIPMMLWDHLDLAPIYRDWQQGSLVMSDLWRPHGGHLHTAAYAVLLATTRLSNGNPLLDCLVSWALLVVYAAIVMSMAKRTLPRDTAGDAAVLLVVVLLALYPGHLANLQWGWQVAVFLCLVGTATSIWWLSRDVLSWQGEAIALMAGAVAFLSFATAIALIPTAIVLIALHRERTRVQRLAFIAPWAIAGAWIAARYVLAPQEDSLRAPLSELMRYELNYIGAGIARYSNDAAPVLAIAGIASAAWMFVKVRDRSAASPWLGLVLFGAFAGVLTAAGRVGAYGPDQAFVTRYVSFSSMFWLGWLGLVAVAGTVSDKPARWPLRAVAAMAVLAVFNALHMTRKAAHVAAEARDIAQTLRATYPDVDDTMLHRIYFDDAKTARRELDAVHKLGFPPFDAARTKAVLRR